MNRLGYILLILLIATGLSCAKNRGEPLPRSSARVEIIIGTPGTRADPTPDPGHPDERTIEELDLLIFEQGVFSYRRQGYKLDENNRFRATLLESGQEVTCHLLANCRQILDNWEQAGGHDGKTWKEVQSELKDMRPARLTGDPVSVPLPMWAVTSGTVLTTKINTWGPVSMLRSVASVDLYVEQRDETSLFELTDLYLWYAPDRGYLAPVPDPDDPQKYVPASPPDMQTTLTTDLNATRVERMTVMRDDSPLICDAIAYQIYSYDNDVTPPSVTPLKRFSRAILGGYYDRTGDPATWPKSWYPLDFAYPDGTLRPLVRNWKYEFIVTAVNGPGYGSPDEAAENYPVDINVEFIDWDREGIDIGVTGKYYVSLDRRQVSLSRQAGAEGRVGITYRIYDDVPGENFTLTFADDANGTQQSVGEGIRNDWFSALLEHDVASRSAVLRIGALNDYDPPHSKETVILRFRDLRFDIAVTQYDAGYGDWDAGGNQDEEFPKKND